AFTEVTHVSLYSTGFPGKLRVTACYPMHRCVGGMPSSWQWGTCSLVHIQGGNRTRTSIELSREVIPGGPSSFQRKVSGQRIARQTTSRSRPASSWHTTPGGTATHRSHAARVSATG